MRKLEAETIRGILFIKCRVGGVPPSAVENAIQNGQKSSGNKPARTKRTAADGLEVVTEGGRGITVINR